MATTKKSGSAGRGKKSGPKDKSYANKNENFETRYEPKRKTPAKRFGKSVDDKQRWLMN